MKKIDDMMMNFYNKFIRKSETQFVKEEPAQEEERSELYRFISEQEIGKKQPCYYTEKNNGSNMWLYVSNSLSYDKEIAEAKFENLKKFDSVSIKIILK